MKIKKLNNTLNSLIQKANVFTYLKEKKNTNLRKQIQY